MSRSLTVVRDGVPTAVAVDGAANLLAFLGDHGVAVDAPCGGAGTCGRCVVRVTGSEAADAVEHALLGPERLAAGERLACRTPAVPGLTVVVPTTHGGARHKGELGAASPGPDPPLRRRRVALPPPSLDDPTPDLERLLRHSGCAAHRLPLEVLRELPATLRGSGYRVDLIVAVGDGGEASGTLLAVAPATTADAPARTGPWGVAVDLGTTTVAAYLVDLGAGRAVDVHAELNRQAEAGADVLTRIAHARTEGVAGLRRRVAGQLEAMVGLLAARNGLGPEDVVEVTVAGNTTMLHMLLGLDPSGIGAAPFVPVTTTAAAVGAGELGLALHPSARVRTLPAVSAYLGADTVAAVLAAGMDEADDVSLLVDLGTNGEVVLGNAAWLWACSAAAGPAFEGARIRCGVGGIDGAVVAFAPGTDGRPPSVTTIGGGPAVGICGAGLLDLVAALLDAGVIDEGGRLLPGDELPEGVSDQLRQRCRTLHGGPAFLVVPAGETRDGTPIVLTERDVRELQFAKAAVAAGIDTLLGAAGMAAEEVQRVFLAGGFGSFLDAGAAARVGLLPTALASRVETLGNAAGVGAVMAATSRSRWARCERIAGRVRVLELSGSAAFADAFLSRIGFGAG